MRVVRRLDFLVYAAFLGFAAFPAWAEEPQAALRLEEHSRIAFEPDVADVVLLPVRATGVKELSVKLVKVEKGASVVSQTILIHPPAGNSRDAPYTGTLALLLIKRDGGKVVAASLGKSFKGGGTTGFGTGPATVPASGTTVFFYTPAGNWPTGQAAVAYGKLYGSKGNKEETVDIMGYSVEDVEKISKRYPHLSYILVILSWSPLEGK